MADIIMERDNRYDAEIVRIDLDPSEIAQLLDTGEIGLALTVPYRITPYGKGIPVRLLIREKVGNGIRLQKQDAS